MKKLFLYTVAVAGLALASCSNDEVLNVTSASQERAISFSDAYVGKHTKTTAADPSHTIDSLTQITVYGYQNETLLFDATTVSRDGDKWVYSPLKYWMADTTYYFTALANEGNLASITNALSAHKASIVTTGSYTNDGKTDLLASSWVSKTGIQTTTVDFTFNHLLAKVKFTFKNGFASTDDAVLKVDTVTITDAPKTASLKFVAGASADTLSWTDLEEAGSLELAFGNTEKFAPASSDLVNTDATGDAKVNEAKDEAAQSLLLIPAEERDYTVTFFVSLFVNTGSDNEFVSQTFKHEVTIKGLTLKAGYSYNLVATLSSENINPDTELKPIEFSIESVKAWEDGNDSNGETTYSDPTPEDDNTDAPQED
jgi:hypothetical protein